ncbi:MAG: translation initiation factor [Haloplasmataceae bacterium]|jgi:translation initiation factor IF-2|nr:translation initiation factor [Haloplasmataceae bacterium]
MRVHEFAKKYNLTINQVIDALQKEGYDVKDHMFVITDEAIAKLENIFDLNLKQAPKDSDDKYWEDEFEKDFKEAKKKKTANKNKSKGNKEERISNIPVISEDDKKHIIYFNENLTVGNIAEQLNKPVSEIIKNLIMLGILATVNQVLDRDTVELIASEAGFELKDEVITNAVDFEKIVFEDSEKDLENRPPVVTIMGHVDHGKTTLLDAIRHSRVVTTEAGGITQHIGAYQVEKNGKKITFIDTPGHAAFTAMRARGAQITDITILVVAADDGVMPQTREALEHARAAKVPIIVAVNKMDKPGANPDKVMQQLAELDLLPEEWGGQTIYCKIAALKNQGIDELLEMIILVADMAELKANRKRLASGTVIEAKLDKGRGPVATLLVQNGTLRVGDSIVVGNTFGKIRAMVDDLARNVINAGPSTPIEIIGLNEVPKAGDNFMVFGDEKEVRKIAEAREQKTKDLEFRPMKAVSLEDIFEQIKEGELKELNIILKADMQGSLEALSSSLLKINVEGVKINIIRSGVGAITETDVTLAKASGAFIIGFNVRPTGKTRELAKEEKVDIRLHNIIYKVIEEIDLAMQGMLDPVYQEKIIGNAEIRNTFKVTKIGTIAGCMVTSGSIKRAAGVRVIRDGIVVFEGKLSTLKRFKDDAKEVNQGYECGITIENYNDINVGDILECYVMEEVK